MSLPEWAKKLLDEHSRAREALEDIYSEITHGVTANPEFIEQRFTEGMRNA